MVLSFICRACPLKLNEIKMKEEKVIEEQTKELLELLMKAMAKVVRKSWCWRRKRRSVKHSWK